MLRRNYHNSGQSNCKSKGYMNSFAKNGETNGIFSLTNVCMFGCLSLMKFLIKVFESFNKIWLCTIIKYRHQELLKYC